MILIFLPQDKDHLPEVLYLQADNCAKDNKNYILIGFLASLVHQDVFRKVGAKNRLWMLLWLNDLITPLENEVKR